MCACGVVGGVAVVVVVVAVVVGVVVVGLEGGGFGRLFERMLDMVVDDRNSCLIEGVVVVCDMCLMDWKGHCLFVGVQGVSFDLHKYRGTRWDHNNSLGAVDLSGHMDVTWVVAGWIADVVVPPGSST